ncbi:ABC transporter ATP-binding protein [Chloroflexota bacterium]
MALLETVNLCQQYEGKEALKNVNISLNRGEIFALIGPSGAGKTTLLRLIDLIDSPSSGEIYFDGRNIAVSDRLAIRRRIAFVLQKPAVFNTTVYNNLAIGLKWRGLSRSYIHQQVGIILEMVGMTEYHNRNARSLSGGEAQRVAIGRALAVKPEVLLLDEPTANLDPRSATAIEKLLANIIEQRATTIIMSTHDMGQGQRLADRIAVLVDGTIQQSGSFGEVFSHPSTKDVAEFVGLENVIDGTVTTNNDKNISVAVNDGIIEAVADIGEGHNVSVCIRPENITIALDNKPSSARNRFYGKLIRIITVGPLARVELDCGFPLIVVVTKISAEELALETGKTVCATFKATAVHVIPRN